MLLTDDIQNVWDRQDDDLETWLQTYAKYAHELNYYQPTFINEVQTALQSRITKFAKTNSPLYHKRNSLVTKDDLQSHKLWYTDIFGLDNQTSGSTTGTRFQYRYWNKTYETIECHGHYRLVANEFGIQDKPTIAYLMLDSNDPTTTKLANLQSVGNPIISHGFGQNATVHTFIANQTYFLDYYKFYESIIDYLTKVDFDIILAPGNVIAALAWNVKRLKCKQPLAKLMSNTGQKVNRLNLDYLVNNGNITNWCDHMRCWDGGATFITCKHHTYHLLDGYATTIQGDNNELISWDYFSLPAPFVNYWNGDFVSIGKKYSQCACGRYYRDFSIGRTRSLAYDGINSNLIRSRLLGVLSTNVKRIDLRAAGFVRIFSHQPLASGERQEIRTIFSGANVNFITEETLDDQAS